MSPTNQSPTRPKLRDLIYDVLDGERDYQQANFPDSPKPTISEFAALIDEYAIRLCEPFVPESPSAPVLTVEQEAARAKVAQKRFREIAAIAIHAMEIYGTTPREYPVPMTTAITGTMHATVGADKLTATPKPAENVQGVARGEPHERDGGVHDQKK